MDLPKAHSLTELQHSALSAEVCQWRHKNVGLVALYLLSRRSSMHYIEPKSRQRGKMLSFNKKLVDYLGFRLTPHGVELQPKKIDAMMRIEPPKTKKQLRCFIGLVNYY
jgi:hypothetical protein